MSPKRIQMTRSKPWRPENPEAVIVSRGSKWGNPFRVGKPIDQPCHADVLLRLANEAMS